MASTRSTLTVSAMALAAAATAVGVYLTTGQVPDAPTASTDAGVICTVGYGIGPCNVAQALAADAGEIDCSPGQVVTRPVEQVIDPAAYADGGAGAQLPPGLSFIPGSAAEVDCATLERPSKALTVVGITRPVPNTIGPCFAGRVGNRSASIAGDGGVTYGPVTDAGIGLACGARYVCLDPPCPTVPPVVGGTPTWRSQLCHDRPDLCPDGGLP